jgi:hypothetical protein
MGKNISTVTRQELLKALRSRYQDSTKKEKMQILNEFVAVSGYHRKHAIRLLSKRSAGLKERSIIIGSKSSHGLKIYDEAVKEALILTWEAADRICGKRLKAILPDFVDAMERHRHLNLDTEVKNKLLSASASTIDRLLAPIRSQAKPRKKRRKSPKVNKKIPVRTFTDWNDPNPGYLEIDFVVHCGGSMAGTYIHSLVATDVCSGWTDCLPLLAREQSLVVEGLEALFRQIPFHILGIDSDNDSAFINDTLLDFCKEHQIEFTRSRAYRKNDQAWIEQKNGAVVRRLVGHERFSGIVAGQALAHLYQSARLYTNFFQPSFKLREKVRNGAKVKRTYDRPKTPCDRILKHPSIEEKIKETLRSQRRRLDPVELLHRIREGQAALSTLVSGESASDGPGSKTLDQFLSQLPKLWQSGEVRPTHRKKPAKPRHWRTRKDPFVGVWFKILGWLQHNPDTTAKALFDRLQREHPGRFPDVQLRTLQRRVKEWRQVMARKLVYACIDGNGDSSEAKVVGGG